MKRLLLILFIVFLSTVPEAGKAYDFTPQAGVQVNVLRLYPNPATTVINIDFTRGYERGYTLQIFNFLGKVMYEQQNLPEKNSINLTQFTRGLYIYQLRDRSNRLVETGRFQVVK